MKTNDLIYRQAAIDVLVTMQGLCTSKEALIQNSKIWQQIKDLPSAQPEITDEQAIDHLQATGWMQEHDRQMYEMKIKEQLKNAEPGRCNDCRYNLKLEKYDYLHGGCQHSDYDGFACMAFASEGTAVHMVGSNPETKYCECWMPRKGDGER